MGFILSYILFPFIAISAGVMAYYKTKIWWFTPFITMVTYIVINIMYVWAGYGRMEIIQQTTLSINVYSISFSIMSAIIVYKNKDKFDPTL